MERRPTGLTALVVSLLALLATVAAPLSVATAVFPDSTARAGPAD